MVYFDLWRLVVSVCFQGKGGGVSGFLIARHATLHNTSVFAGMKMYMHFA